MFPLYDIAPTKKTPLINYLLIIFTSLVFLVELTVSNIDSFVYKWALVPSNINFSNLRTLYPFITSIFLHGSFFHIFSNLWFLRIFGDNVEDDLGHIQYFLFYIFGGIFAALTQYIIIPHSTIPFLGASGAISAVLGYYFVRFPSHYVKTVVPLFPLFFTVDLPAYILLFYWFITQFFNGTSSLIHFTNTQSSGGIAWWAHIGGFAFGYLYGLFNKKLKGSFN